MATGPHNSKYLFMQNFYRSEECDANVVPDPMTILNSLDLYGEYSFDFKECSSSCRLVPGKDCGDGNRKEHEACDDGNLVFIG